MVEGRVVTFVEDEQRQLTEGEATILESVDEYLGRDHDDFDGRVVEGSAKCLRLGDGRRCARVEDVPKGIPLLLLQVPCGHDENRFKIQNNGEKICDTVKNLIEKHYQTITSTKMTTVATLQELNNPPMDVFNPKEDTREI